MGKYYVSVVATVALCLLLSQASYSASWVESNHGGMSIRHPRGWNAVWEEAGVEVSQADNPTIWCAFSTFQWQGTAQQFINALLDHYRNELQDLRVLQKRRVSKKPDTYGVRFTYNADGIPMGSLVLATTEDRKNISTRSYAAPIKDYDKMKLVLIPILLSLKYEQVGKGRGGTAREPTKLSQVLGSPNRYWQMKAPRGWRSIDMGQDESIEARCVGPKGGAIGVNILCGLARSHTLRMRIAGGNAPLMSIPYLSAAELFQRVLLPYHQTESPDMRLKDLKPLDQSKARYSVTYTDRQGGGTVVQEGIVINNSLPDLYGGDFNVYTRYWVAAPAQSFPGVKNQLWQTLQTFEPSPNFGAAVIQILMQMRQETQQAMHNAVMNTIRTNQRMMRQTTQTTMHIMRDRRQEGIGWGLALSGEDLVRDPDTGKQYRIPMGGEYIYGRPTGAGQVDTIRGGAPILPSELPLGFRAFEQVSITEAFK